MELYVFFAAVLLLPLAGQLALLRLGRSCPRLRFVCWLLLLIPVMFALLAVQAGRENGFFSGLAVLFYLAAALASFMGWGLGWLFWLLRSRRRP